MGVLFRIKQYFKMYINNILLILGCKYNSLNVYLKSNPNEQINCVWFCINGTTFQEKEYIESLMNAYNEKNKIPFIFAYTKAIDCE